MRLLKQTTLICLVGLVAMMSCTGAKYKISVTFPTNAFDGRMVYLTNYDSGDTIDSAAVTSRTATLAGTVGEPYFARLIVDGQRVGMIVEGGEIAVNWETKAATGSPLNKKLEDIDKEMKKIESEFEQVSEDFKAEKITEAQAKAKGDEINKSILDFFEKTYTANKDNAIGPWSFCQFVMQQDLNEQQLNALLAKAPSSYKQLKRVQKALSDIKAKEATAVGKKFTDFTYTRRDGTKVKLSSYAAKNGVWLVVDFWASWCGPCRAEIQGPLKKIYESYDESKVRILGVAVWDDPRDTQKAIEELDIKWDVMIEDHNTAEPTDLYGISGIPHIMIIDPQGVIRSRGLQGDDLVAKVKELVGE